MAGLTNERIDEILHKETVKKEERKAAESEKNDQGAAQAAP